MSSGAGLAYPKDTTTLRRHPGRPPTAAAGPYRDGVEQLTAYLVIDCASLEQARQIGQEGGTG